MPSDIPSPFGVTAHRDGGALVLTVAGELDLATAETAYAALAEAIAASPAAVVVDLRGLAFMDSTGLLALVRAKSLADDSGVRLAVLNGTGEPNRLLTLSGMDTALEMVDDVAQLSSPADPDQAEIAGS